MEPPGATIGGTRSSALPRLSKLPQPRSSGATESVDEGHSTPSSGVTSIPSRPFRSSTIDFQRPASAMRSLPNPFSPVNKRQSMLIKPGFQTSALREAQEGGFTNMVSPTSPPPTMRSIGDTNSAPADDTSSTTSAENPARRPRPSLSDRTLETLSQVPPTPSPRRRQSGFYSIDSPMRPPSRAASALSVSRPESRASNSHSGIRPPERLQSPSKRPAGSVSHGQPLASSPSKRSISSSASQIGTATSSAGSLMISTKTSRMKPPSSTAALARGTGNKASNGHSKNASRSIAVRSPTKDMFGGPLPNAKPTIATITRQVANPLTIKRGQISTVGVPKALRRPQLSNGDGEPLDLSLETKPVSPSQGLREAISRAKAARKSSTNRAPQAFIPRSTAPDAYANLGPEADPNTLDLMDSTHINIVKKRIHNARGDGKLNIAALCLTEIPTEVLKMYEFDPNNQTDSPWYENVDVTRLLAADNEIAELPAELFPNRKRSTQMDLYDDEMIEGVFGGLETLDLHGNQLRSIPLPIGNLENLTILKVSRNKLGNEALKVIATIKSLKELRVGENLLSESLVDEIGNLENLELLDVHGNSIIELPSSIGKLSKLKTLNVSDNRLSSLPFEAIFDLPLLELMASRNRLSGSLLPNSIPHIPSLRTLDVSINALTCITENKVEFPSLKTLNISNNRISELPNVSTWLQLISINAEENKISAIPEGFTKLSNLTHVDLGNNSLLQIDDAIGFMDSLTVLRIGNNPIRDRRLLRMGFEDLKSELRSRQVAEPISDQTARGALPITHSTSSWPVSGGTVDRSNTKLVVIHRKDLDPIAHEGVRTLSLHHNQLQTFSPAIELLGGTLTSLDISHNKLGKSGVWMAESICLPNLHTLNLTSNGLTSLDPLVTHLSAPRLETLILPFNRLVGLPLLCQAFSSLVKLMAANNAIKVLDVESVRGLQVLDISSNEIDHLPPKLGILQGQLQTLMVSGNKFRVPGWGILEKGTEEILKFCKNRIPAGEEGAVTSVID